MAWHRITLVAFLVMGCHFDSSVQATSDELVDAGPGGFSSGCGAFVPQPCGECGTLRCSEGAEGTQIECVGPLDRGSCAANQVCNQEGQCETADAVPPCQLGEVRPCGECAEELCEAGQWSGQCEPRHDRCDGANDEHCLEPGSSDYRCETSCSTVGHRTPCTNGPGDSGPIPDFVPPGTYWHSRDLCDEADECLECLCFIDFSGNARVDCDFSCE